MIYIQMHPSLSDLVQDGTSEKVASSAQYLAAFVTGFVLAYIRNWRLALALSSILPGVIIAGSLMNHFTAEYMQWVPPPSLVRRQISDKR